MPEYPDIVIYIEALEQRILGETLERVVVTAPFLLRTAVPPINEVQGREVTELRRIGKRICIAFEGDIWLVLHLMIAGRLHWNESRPSTKPTNRLGPKNRLATFEFPKGSLSLTEAGTKRRASLHVVVGSDLEKFNPGGLEIFETDLSTFSKVLTSSNHTLKRALTDPRMFSGIGNAYSDEIFFNAKLSPIALTQKLTKEEIARLFDATKFTLTEWTNRFRDEAARVEKSKKGSAFPEKVTAFRPEMAVHGKYLEPCPRCGSKIQRIRYASNETNYCPNCQTGGKLLADRALSRLLRSDWPRSVEELEGLTRER